MKFFVGFLMIFVAAHCSAQLPLALEVHQLDSIKKINSSFNPGLPTLPDSLFGWHKGKAHFSFSPEATVNVRPKQTDWLGGLTFQGQYAPSAKWSFNWNATPQVSNGLMPAYESSILPVAYFSQKLDSGVYLSANLRFRGKFSPNKYVDFETGMDQHHVGMGDRSLLMSMQAMPSPFVSARVKLWKLEYVIMQQVFREGLPGHYQPKANSAHMLTFKHNHHFGISVFESVTHIIKDTLYNRGFDPEYLNPLIVYRPQEYSLGSSDNAMLGIDAFVRIKRAVVYSQFVLDEFLLSAIRARNRWWANKYAFQLGVKWAKQKGAQHFFARSEFNLIRPYTYAHLSTSLNYGNQSLPVAHPLGANLLEWYADFAWQHKNFNASIWSQLLMRGDEIDTSLYSYGADIYESYVLHTPEYGVRIGNGTKIHSFTLGAHAGYKCWKGMAEFFVEPRIRLAIQNGQQMSPTFWIAAGIQSSLWQRRRNYGK